MSEPPSARGARSGKLSLREILIARELRDCPGARPLAIEGFFQSLAQGLGEAYLGAFALWLSAGSFALGLIGSLPTAGTALAQAASARLRGGRGAKRFIRTTWALQAALYALLGLCALLPPRWALSALCLLAALTWSLGGVTVPGWSSWVTKVIPNGRLGEFFGLRGATQQGGILIAIVGGGFLLSFSSRWDSVRLGFILMFVVAGASRAAGSLLLARVPEGLEARRSTDLRAGLGLLRNSKKFRRLCFYLWGLHFGTHVAAPFFVPYMLRDLELSYGVVGLLIAVPALVKALTLRYWGRLADHLGPGPLLRTAGWFVVPVAALWLVSGSPRWLTCAQVYAGLAWGAFELAQASALLQASRGREAAIAVFNLIDGLSMIGGALLGGFLVFLLEAFAIHGFLGAMGVSSVLRALPATVLLWRIRGVGRPGRSHLGLPLRLWAVRPTRGAVLRPWVCVPPESGAGEDPRESEVKIRTKRRPRSETRESGSGDSGACES